MNWQQLISIRKGVEFKGANLWILIFAIFMASLGLNVELYRRDHRCHVDFSVDGAYHGVGLSVGLNDFELMNVL